MSTQDNRPQPAARRSRWFRMLAPVLVLLVGAVTAVALMQSGPSAKREPPPRQARLVETRPLVIGSARTRIDAMGTVMPAESVTLQPQVGGEIISVSDDLEPGGLFRTGDELLRIDPRDYELAVLQRESEVAQAQSTLRLEQGQQSIARREFEILNESLQDDDQELVLRKPQLESVRAQLALAKAKLEQAKLDLQRSRIRAPFNAIVESIDVDVGTRVTSASTLATLAGTDSCWLEVSVPVKQLKWIDIPRGSTTQGSRVRITNPAAWGAGTFREDLFYRLSVFTITLPPLRDRREEIPLLTHHFMHRFAKEFEKPIDAITPQAMAVLEAHDWPGNVRELEHAVERAVLLTEGRTIDLDAIPTGGASPIAAWNEVPDDAATLADVKQELRTHAADRVLDTLRIPFHDQHVTGFHFDRPGKSG